LGAEIVGTVGVGGVPTRTGKIEGIDRGIEPAAEGDAGEERGEVEIGKLDDDRTTCSGDEDTCVGESGSDRGGFKIKVEDSSKFKDEGAREECAVGEQVEAKR